MTRPLNDQGVSVIIGTLLLILITVTAAAALGLMVSQMQKDAMNRQSHINAVNSEKIQISGVMLNNNNDTWFQLGVNNSQNWSSISFNMMNLNTQDVSINGIAINNHYLFNFSFTSLSGSVSSGNCTSLGNPQGWCNTSYASGSYSNSSFFTIPAGQSTKIKLDLTSITSAPPIGPNDQIDIKVLTSLTNIFEQIIKPPTAVISYNTAITTLGTTQQDNIVLDGSQSSSENATIVSWNWTLMNATQTITNLAPMGSCSDTNILSTVDVPPYFSTKTVHFSPTISGPFCVNLTVQDSNGMITSSGYQLIPKDAGFVPPSYLTYAPGNDWSTNLTHKMNVTVYNIRNAGVPGQPVSYSIGQPSDTLGFNWTLDSSFNHISETDQDGTVTYDICGNGTVTVGSGNLPAKTIITSGNGNCQI